MKLRLKSPRQKRSEELIKKTVAMFNNLKDVEGSDWQKYERIAKKLLITQNYVGKIIKAHRNENRPSADA